MTTVMRKGDFARHVGVSAPRVSVLVRRGLPVRPDRKIDLEAALEWMKANVATQAGWQDRGIHKVLGTAANPRNPKRAAPIAAASAKASHAPPDEALLDDETGALPYADAKALRETFLARKARLEFLKEKASCCRRISSKVGGQKYTLACATGFWRVPAG